MKKENLFFYLSWLFRLFIDVIGYSGLAMIVYEMLTIYSGQRWGFIDNTAYYVSTILTFISTILTALSVYYYDSSRNPPEKISVYIGAPMVILASIIGLVLFLAHGKIPINVVNGFSLMAFSGALARIHKNPTLSKTTAWQGWNKKKINAEQPKEPQGRNKKV